MKRKYLILVGVGIFSVLCILWLTVEDKLKEYFILDNQQNRVEQNVFLIIQTINQYNNLFGNIPSSFSDSKLAFLLKENINDSLILKLNPKIISDNKIQRYYLYLDGPDGINDSLRVLINEDYVPTKTRIINKSFIQYYFSKGDILIGSSSYLCDCSEKSRRFISINGEDNIVINNENLRKLFYNEVNNYINDYVRKNNIIPSSRSYFAYCHFKFDGDDVNYSILCLRDGSVNTINNFIMGLSDYFKGKNLGVKEVYFPILINEALIKSPRH